MGYAIKENVEGRIEFRSVDDKSCCGPDEHYSESQPEIPQAQPDVELLRRIAYADPHTGSDRYLMEAVSLVVAGADWGSEEVKALQSKALQAKEEIKKLYPY